MVDSDEYEFSGLCRPSGTIPFHELLRVYRMLVRFYFSESSNHSCWNIFGVDYLGVCVCVYFLSIRDRG